MSTSYVNNYPTSGYASETQLRDEFTKVRDALLDTVSRTNSGSGSNAMEADLDLGDNDIINTNTINAKNIVTDNISLQGIVVTLPDAVGIAYATQEQMVDGEAGVLTDAEQVRREHVAQVPTIVELRLLEPAFDGQSVNLCSYHDLPIPSVSKGGGTWTAKFGNYSSFVSADALTGRYVAFPSDPTGTTGAWVRDDTGYISVTMYGAKLDGSNDDAPAVQAAVDNNLGSPIHIPGGICKIDSPIFQDTTGLGNISVCRFYGDGTTKTIIDNNTPRAAFKVTSGSGAEFAYGFGLKDLTIKSLSSVGGSMGIEMIGCRFVKLERLFIDGMDFHGIYGASSVGDLTDTAHVEMIHTQVENCGGYGVYAKTAGDAIQYQWNMYQCRIGSNTLGGILGESLTNSEIKNCGIYYNGGFGIQLKNGTSGAPSCSLVNIEGCEFDTNEGVQIDLQAGHGLTIKQPYLIDNNLTPAFTKGIYVGACQSVVIEQAVPRMNPAVTGKIVVDVSASASDVVARDSDYQGWASGNGSYYVDASGGQFSIDDRNNRLTQYNGTWVAEIKNATASVTSPTTVTGHYAVNGKHVIAGFRFLSDIDFTGFIGADTINVTLPVTCKSDGSGFCGSCIVTNDSGSGIPVPTTSNSASVSTLYRAGSGAPAIVSELTSGASDITFFTLDYMRD